MTNKPAGGLGALVSTTKHALREMGAGRSVDTLLKANQKAGFDCPGCAWPEPEDRSSFEFCENGAKAIAHEATKKRVGPDFFAQWSIEELLQQSDMWLERQGRLTHPMILRPGASHYTPISWSDAFTLLGEELQNLDDPNEAIFYTSGRTSNEAAFLYQLFARQFGTNNLPDCSNMCHESSGRGLGETIGVGKGTVGLQDFEKADAIFIFGQNPGTNHPRMLTTLQEAARRGCRIVSVNPMREPSLVSFIHPQEVWNLGSKGTLISELYLQVRINGDIALMKGMAKVMLEAEKRAPGTVLDHKFIKEHTEGFEAYADAVRKASWKTIETQSGLTRRQIIEAAQIYMKAKSSIICWAMGLTQHKNGVGNIQEAVNLLLMRGNMGRPGAGACPVRGHSNVQGDRTMGIIERPSEALLNSLEKRFKFSPPKEHGWDTVQAIEAMHDGRGKIFFGMGGNFHSATPDTDYTAEALRRCRMTIQVSTKLNRSHLVTGKTALIFPCRSRTEIDIQATGPQFVTVENSMSIVHSSEGKLTPASTKLLSEPMIVQRMALAALPKEMHPLWKNLCDNYDAIRNLIEDIVPGFENYNQRVRRPEGFLLPNGARDRTFKTANEKARFTVHPIPVHNLAPGEYLMMTVRSHDQYNTTIYGMDDRYRGVKNKRRVILMNRRDIKTAGFRKGTKIKITSHFQGEERSATDFEVIPYSIPRGCVATYFPEANVLVPIKHRADKSNTPASKSIVVTLQPSF